MCTINPVYHGESLLLLHAWAALPPHPVPPIYLLRSVFLVRHFRLINANHGHHHLDAALINADPRFISPDIPAKDKPLFFASCRLRHASRPSDVSACPFRCFVDWRRKRTTLRCHGDASGAQSAPCLTLPAPFTCPAYADYPPLPLPAFSSAVYAFQNMQSPLPSISYGGLQ